MGRSSVVVPAVVAALLVAGGGAYAVVRHRPATASAAADPVLATTQIKRVDLTDARLLPGNPDLVLADEPTGALDSANGAAVLSLLTTLNAEGATIVVITHDRDIAARLPRQVVMHDGRVVR